MAALTLRMSRQHEGRVELTLSICRRPAVWTIALCRNRNDDPSIQVAGRAAPRAGGLCGRHQNRAAAARQGSPTLKNPIRNDYGPAQRSEIG